MVCVIITMFNFFEPTSTCTDQRVRDSITKQIKEAFTEDGKETIKNVMFDRGEVDPPAQ